MENPYGEKAKGMELITIAGAPVPDPFGRVVHYLRDHGRTVTT